MATGSPFICESRVKKSLAITYKQRRSLMGISSDPEIYVPLPAGLCRETGPGITDLAARGSAAVGPAWLSWEGPGFGVGWDLHGT